MTSAKVRKTQYGRSSPKSRSVASDKKSAGGSNSKKKRRSEFELLADGVVEAQSTRSGKTRTTQPIVDSPALKKKRAAVISPEPAKKKQRRGLLLEDGFTDGTAGGSTRSGRVRAQPPAEPVDAAPVTKQGKTGKQAPKDYAVKKSSAVGKKEKSGGAPAKEKKPLKEKKEIVDKPSERSVSSRRGRPSKSQNAAPTKKDLEKAVETAGSRETAKSPRRGRPAKSQNAVPTKDKVIEEAVATAAKLASSGNDAVTLNKKEMASAKQLIGSIEDKLKQLKSKLGLEGAVSAAD